MPDPKVTYYKDVSNDARALSSEYEMKEVDGIFCEIKATRKEGEDQYDIVKEFDLGSASVSSDTFCKFYKREILFLQKRFEKSSKASPEQLKEWKAPYNKVLEEWENIDEQEFETRRRFWHAGGGGLYITSRHPGTDEDPEGHDPIAYFRFWKEGLEAE